MYNAAQTAGWSYIMFLMISHYQAGKATPRSLYNLVELPLQIFQTAALLEIFHAAIGLVKSNPVITGLQVFSRVFVVWPILFSVPATRSVYGFVMLLTAWTITEIIRYAFYVFNIIKMEVSILTWLRYTLFIVLYPLGVSGELWCITTALPIVGQTGKFSFDLPNKWNFAFDFKIFCVLIMMSYLPVFPQLYLHMFAQRRKLYGGGGEKSKKA